MSPIGHTLDFPRKDNIYTHKEALPFDESKSLVWKSRLKSPVKENFLHWIVYSIAGCCIGFTAFLMDKLEELLVGSNRKLLQYIIDQNTVVVDGTITNPTASTRWISAWLCYSGICGFLGLCAGIMTVYYGPGANGSGVAEMIGYMNGVNYPKFMRIDTLLTKILGVVLAVSSRLCIGKEGPLAHIGAIEASMAAYIPGLGFEILRNDQTKRLLVAAGGSAGVAAAFGAPIGGALFAYEMSKPSSFWSFQMIWKTFITCSFAVLVLAIF